MLAFIRRALSSWVVLLLLGLLVVAFVITGVKDPFGSSGVAGGSLAKVGKSNITEPAFAAEFDRFMRRARETNPQLTNAEAAKQGGVEQILEKMIQDRALEEFGRKHGVAISRRAIDGQIASIPGFQSGGKFDDATFRKVLADNRITEKELRDGLSGDAIRNQLLQHVAIGTRVPLAMVEPYASLLLETRQGSVGVIPASADVGTPSEAQLQAFYKDRIASYTIPERRAFRYALLTPEAAMAGVTISEEEVKRYYDEHAETYGGIEQRQLLQAVVPSQATADRIATRVKAGEPFAKVAGELAKLTATDLDVGTVTQKRFADATSAQVAAAAFAAPSSGVAGPVKSDFGWHVVQVARVISSPKRPLETVRAEITAKLREEKSQDALSDAVAAAQDAFDGGQSFADVAKAKKLTVVEVPPVTRAGTAPGNPFRLDPKLTKVLAAAFEPENAGQPSVQEVDKQLFALLDVGDSVPATPIPLDQIRPQVTQNWVQVERMNRAKATAAQIVAEVAKGKTLAAALAERRLKPPTTASVRRMDMGRERMNPAVAALFTLTEGSARALPAGAAGYLVVRVDKVTPGDPRIAPGIAQATRAQIANAEPDELARQFIRAVEQDVGIKRDPKAIARVRARYAGEGDASQQ